VRKPAYQRILLKLSGEALMGRKAYGIDEEILAGLSKEIREVTAMGVQVALVVGGGNIFRGIGSGRNLGIDRASADYMGMLATVINSIALQEVLEQNGVTRVQTAIEMHEVAEPFIHRKAMRHLEKGRVVIFAAGTGNPYFSTDTAAALRASEIGANILIKATKVDGVYDKDPKRNPDAKRFERMTYIQALNMRVGVMDNTALTLCMDNDLPIIVLDLWQPNAVEQAVLGEPVGTLVSA